MLEIHTVMPVFLIQYRQAGAMASRNGERCVVLRRDMMNIGVKTAAWVAGRDLRATLEAGQGPLLAGRKAS